MVVSLSDKLNKNPLTECDEHITRLETIIGAAGSLNMGELEARDLVVDTLEYAVAVLKGHYRNLLHCYAIAEKGKD